MTDDTSTNQPTDDATDESTDESSDQSTDEADEESGGDSSAGSGRLDEKQLDELGERIHRARSQAEETVEGVAEERSDGPTGVASGGDSDSGE